MKNRGIGRGRAFMGTLLLCAALISWFTGFMMSPHGGSNGPSTFEVRSTVVVFLRNSALGNLVLCAVSAWLLLPLLRRGRRLPNFAILAALGLIIFTSLYQLIWLRSLTY